MSSPTLPERILPASTREGLPVMAGALPVLGHTLALHLDVPGALRRAAETLGPAFWVSLGFGSWYLFCARRSSFDLLKHPKVVNAGSRATLDFILGRSLLAMDGPDHRRVRVAMNPTFSPRGLAESGSGAVIAEVVRARAERWASLGELRVHAETKELALDVIFRITGVGNQDLPAWRAQYGELLLGLLPIPWDLPGLPRRRALRAAAWINAEIAKIVERARGEEGASVTHALVHARDEEGRPLSTGELVDNIRLLFLAGHETTATTTALAILELARQPESWDRLVEEALAGPGVPTSLSEARAYSFCEAVFRESVRLYGPAWFLERRVTEDIPWEGLTLKAGTIIGLPPVLWTRDEELYPEPDAFRPERWLDRGAPSPVELSAFGGGAHFCLGYHLAWQEVVAFLVALGRAVGRGRRPTPLYKGRPEVRYLPMLHPPASAAVRFGS